MRSLLYQHLSLVLVLLSTTASVGFYFIHDYFYRFHPQYLYELLIINILISSATALVVGKLVYQLNNRVYTDALTALWNRRYFDIRLNEELQRAKRTGTSFGIALVDVDYFKEINDHYGHITGDQLLITIGNTLQQSTRDIDIVFRWGGDEYAILFPDVNLESLHLITERIKNAVLRNNNCYSRSISVGTLLIDGNMERNQIMPLVDLKLYEDKSRGKANMKGYSIAKAHYC